VKSVKPKILIPIPRADFDPTESGVPWKMLKGAGFDIVFATPEGKKAQCDLRMLNGRGLGPLSLILSANRLGKAAYIEMAHSKDFLRPRSWQAVADQGIEEFEGLILPGGHAPGMREYLESGLLQDLVVKFFAVDKPVGAICHGVVLAARSRARVVSSSEMQSVLYGRKTTALLKTQEMIAWRMTCLWLGKYYRTYPETVEAEVRSVLKSETDFVAGPPVFLRDTPAHLARGFTVVDRNYISARWPGDAHRFATGFIELANRRLNRQP
jgi:protease I